MAFNFTESGELIIDHKVDASVRPRGFDFNEDGTLVEPPKPQPEGGILTDIGHGIASSYQSSKAMIGKTLQSTGIAPDYGAEMRANAERELATNPDLQETAAGQAHTSPYSPRGQVYEGMQSFGQNALPQIIGGAIGAGIGFVSPMPGGAALGARLGFTAASALQLPFFFGSQKQDTYESVFKKQIELGKTPEDAAKIANSTGNVTGSVEVGTEGLGDIAQYAVMFATRNPVAAKAAGSVVKDALTYGVKRAAKTFAGVSAAETGEEIAAGILEPMAEKRMGDVGEGATWESATAPIVPTLISMVPLAGFGAGVRYKTVKSVNDSLADPKANPESRQGAADFVSNSISQQSPAAALQFNLYAKEQIKNEQPVEVGNDAIYSDWFRQKYGVSFSDDEIRQAGKDGKSIDDLWKEKTQPPTPAESMGLNPAGATLERAAVAAVNAGVSAEPDAIPVGSFGVSMQEALARKQQQDEAGVAAAKEAERAAFRAKMGRQLQERQARKNGTNIPATPANAATDSGAALPVWNGLPVQPGNAPIPATGLAGNALVGDGVAPAGAQPESVAAGVLAQQPARPGGEAVEITPPEFDMFGDPVVQPTQSTQTDRPIVEFPVAGIAAQQGVDQFKKGADSKGIVAESKLTGAYDRRIAAPIQLWERLDGTHQIISGRHRLDLAQRNGETTIPSQVYREADGFTKDHARVLDIELNVKDGRGKVVDYVKYFKEYGLSTEQATAEGLLNTLVGRQAHTIADTGGESLIAAHANDAISDRAAVEIARAAPNNEKLQAVGIQAAMEGKSDAAVANLVKAVSVLSEGQPDTLDMFGFDSSGLKQAKDMAKFVATKQSEAGKHLAAITGAAKSPAIAKQYGVDVKDPKALSAKIEELKASKAAWDNWQTNPELIAQIKAGIEGRVAQPEQPYTLESQTRTGLRDRQAGIDAASKEEARLKAEQDKQEKQRRERENIKQRSEGASKNFELGQDAETNLSGQASLFQKAKHYDHNQLDLLLDQQPQRPGENTAETRSDRAGLAADALLRGADGSLLGLSIATDWIVGKGSSLLGKRVTSPADLATLGAVLRDPRAETMRYFMVKEGKVIYHTAVSSRLTNSSAAFIGEPEVFLAELKATMDRLGADGYYLMHNHPGRNVKASTADINLTDKIATDLPGFLGHVILDHTEFGLIKAGKLNGEHRALQVYDEGAQPLNTTGQDPTRTNPIPHAKLDSVVGNPSELASMADAVRQPDNVVLVAVDGQMHVTGIMGVSRESMKKGGVSAFKNLMRLRKAAGSTEVFAVLPEGMEFSELDASFTKKGWLLDVHIAVAGKGVSAINENLMAYQRGGVKGKAKPDMAVDQPRANYQAGLFSRMEEAKNEETAVAERKGSPQMDMFAAIHSAEISLSTEKTSNILSVAEIKSTTLVTLKKNGETLKGVDAQDAMAAYNHDVEKYQSLLNCLGAG